MVAALSQLQFTRGMTNSDWMHLLPWILGAVYALLVVIHVADVIFRILIFPTFILDPSSRSSRNSILAEQADSL
jgi:hypothetical protein